MNLRTMVRRTGEEEKPLRFLVSRLLVATGLCQHIVFSHQNSKFRFSPSAVASTMWLEGKATGDELFFKDYLRANDTIVDVGANIGQLTILAAELIGKGGLVYSVEPHCRTFGFLEGNIRLNELENVRTFNCALGESQGTAHLMDLKSDDQNKLTESSTSGVAVSLKTLDSIIETPQDIALLKVDVEGYEKFVFEGGKAVVQSSNCIYFECWDEHIKNFDYEAADIIGFLEQLDFSVYQLASGEQRHLKAVDTSTKFPRCINLFAIKDVQKFVQRTGYTVTP